MMQKAGLYLVRLFAEIVELEDRTVFDRATTNTVWLINICFSFSPRRRLLSVAVGVASPKGEVRTLQHEQRF
jgi:hypothetical protein